MVSTLPARNAGAGRAGRNNNKTETFDLWLFLAAQGSTRKSNRFANQPKPICASNGFDISCYVNRNAATRRAVMMVGGDMAYPTTIVLDRGGVIRGFWQGYSPAAVDEIQRTIEHIRGNKGGP